MLRPCATEGLGKRKNREEADEQDEKKAEEYVDQLPGIPLVPFDTSTKKNGVIFVLDGASLECAKVGKSYQLLDSTDHDSFLRRQKRDPRDYRPDIVHQALLTILDSPLNKAGMLRAVYVRTQKGVLFEVKPYTTIPRTYKRFAGLMLQLLQKLSISATGTRKKLLNVIKNPVTQYLPLNSRKIGFSSSSAKSVTMVDYLASVSNDLNLVFVVGAIAKGKIDKEYIDDFISVSDYPLTAAWCISRICEALHLKWKIQ